MKSTRKPAKKSSGKPVRRRKKAIRWKHVVVLATVVCLLGGSFWWYVRSPAWAARQALMLGKDQEASELLETAEQRWQLQQSWGPRQMVWKADLEFLKARLARHQGEVRNMQKHLMAAQEAGFDMSKVTREQTLAQAQLGHMRDAEKRLAQLLSDPQGDEPEICYAFIQGYLQIQQYDAARRLLKGWSDDFPQDPRPLFLRGTVEMNMELWKEAEQDYRKALQLDPNHHQSAYHLASVLLTQKHPDQAMKYFQIATGDASLRTEALAGQGHCFRLLGKAEKAREVLVQILKNEPDSPTASFELARLDVDSGKYKEALKRLEPIVEQNPRHTEARYQLAIVLREEGRPEEAQAHFQEVRKINEKLANANDLAERITPGVSGADTRLEIARIFLEYGSRREGLMWLRSVLTFVPDHSEALKELESYYRKRFREEPANTRFDELADEYQRLYTASQQDTP